MIHARINGKNWFKVYTRVDLDDIPDDVEWMTLPADMFDMNMGMLGREAVKLKLIATPDLEYFKVCDEEKDEK